MQRAAFRAAALDARYVALEVRDFDAAWCAVRRLEVAGGNVTVPWKEAAVRALEAPSARSVRIHSANTFWRTPDRGLAGTETDGEGFLRGLEEAFGLPARGLRVAVLGAGGAARSVLHALADGGAAALYVWNRASERAAALARDLTPREAGHPEVHLLAGDPQLPEGRSVDLVVNATSLGLRPGDPAAARPAGFPGTRFAMDLIYGRSTAFLREFAQAGARVADGRFMLLHQGALAFELWFARPAPLCVMRAALEEALSKPATRAGGS